MPIPSCGLVRAHFQKEEWSAARLSSHDGCVKYGPDTISEHVGLSLSAAIPVLLSHLKPAQLPLPGLGLQKVVPLAILTVHYTTNPNFSLSGSCALA